MPRSSAPDAPVLDRDDVVERRVRETRLAVKTADIATGVVTLLAGLLVLLLVAAAADHWLVKGGLDRWERFALFAVGLLASGAYVVTRLAPIVLRRVNPLYAAHEIERESPELKNSLLNFLQLRGPDGGPRTAVEQTLRRQAAERLAAAGETPIDHTPLLRVAKLLLALVAVVGLYVIASPKDFFASAGRVLAPWSDLAAPSRVRITDLEPGAVEVAQGERVEIAATITGLRDDELAEVVYSTDDGRLVEKRTPLRLEAGGDRHTVTLPPGGGSAAALGLQTDVVYRLEAGDARSQRSRITVRAAPTIAPVSVRYDYPDYTGYTSREVEGVGDLRAIEGTRVTLTAEANLPIAAAQLDLGADGRPDVRLQTDGQTATGVLTLRRDPSAAGDDQTTYVLRFTSTDDQANHDPPQYRVEVIADLPPEASLSSPVEEVLDVGVDERVVIRGEARDPDFALNTVRLVGETDGRRVVERDLDVGSGRGRVVVETRLTPSEIGLQPGQTLDYWIEAADNRTPNANTTASERQRLRIGQPRDADGEEQPGEGEPQPGDEGAAEGDPQADGREPGDSANESGGEQRQEGGDPSDAGQPPPGGQQDQQRPAAEKGEEGEQGPPPPGGLEGPGEQNDSTDSTDAGERGGEGRADEERGGESQSGGSQSSESNDAADNADPNAGQNGGDAGRPDDAQQTDGGDDSAEPVARDGSDDGSAFERIRKFLEDQRGGESRDQPPRASDQQDSGNGDRQPGDRDPEGGRDGAQAPEDGPEGGRDDNQSQPRDGDSGTQPERPEDGPGAGEQDRRGEQSDSRSSETGDETPPGEPSDSTDAPREGGGDSGQSEAADRGAGQSADRGPGDSSDRPGEQQQADRPTGEEGGQRPGEGRSADDEGGQRQEGGDAADGDRPPSPSDQSAGEKSGDPADGGAEQSSDRGGESATEGQPSEGADRPGDEPLQDRRGQDGSDRRTDPTEGPSALGDRGASNDAPGAGSEVEEGADDANLDYAREQTELVLERLEDQLAEREVDRKLLDKLGWTEDDLRRFVQRWKSRRQRATERGAEGEAELDRALRSLGLSREGPTATRPTTDDTLRDLRQRARTSTPPRLRDALERYNRSLNALSDPPADND